MNTAISSVLNSILGEYCENFNGEQLKLSIFSGTLQLQNLKLRKDIFSLYGMPFVLESGSIGDLLVKIPWTSLTSSPLQVSLSNIFLHVRPRPATEWDEEKEKEFANKGKALELTRFEAINSAQVGSEEPGFMEKMVTKLIDNLEVTIQSVYIRFEDDFAIGLGIKEIVAYTCDENWNKFYTSDAPKTFKKAHLSELRLYLDYKDFQPVGDFYDHANDEMDYSPEHSFLIRPIGFTLYVTLNKKDTTLSEPQITALLESEKLKLDLEAPQLTCMLKMLELLTMFTTFQNGVKSSVVERELADEEGARYRELYKQFKLLSKTDEKINKQLEEIEEKFTLNSIIANRIIVGKEIELLRLEEAKRQEISNIEAPQQGYMARFKGYWYGGQEDAKEKEEKERKIQAAEAELGDIINKKKQLYDEMQDMVKDVPVFETALPPDYVNTLVIAKFPLLAVSLRDTENALLIGSVRNISIESGLRSETMFAKINVESSSIKEPTPTSQHLPDILIGDVLTIDYDQYPSPFLNVSTKSFTMYMNLPVFIKIANVFMPAVSGKIDWAPFLELASEATKDYMESGQKYMQDLLQQGVQTSMDIQVEAKAPLIFVPVDIFDLPQGILMFDLGEIRGSSKKIFKVAECDQYKFDVKNIRALRIMNCKQIDDWESGDCKEILKPVNHILKIVTCSDPKLPNLSFSTRVSNVLFQIDEDVVSFMITLTNASMKQLENYHPPEEVVVEEKRPNSHKELEQTEAYKDKLKNISDVIESEVSARIDSFVIQISQNSDPFAEFAIGGSLLQLKVSSDLSMKGSYTLSEIAISDLRPDVALQRVLFNPFTLEAQDEQIKESHLISSRFLVVPSQDLLTVEVTIQDIRVIPHIEFFTDLQNYFTQQMKALEMLETAQPVPKQEVAVSEYETILNRKITLSIFNVELWLPLDNKKTDSRTASFSFTLDAQYASSQKYINSFDRQGYLVNTRFVSVDDEAIVTVSHIEAIVGYIYGKEVIHINKRTQELLEPSRVSLTYNCTQAHENPPNTLIDINLESFSAMVGFRDYRFFMDVLALWSGAQNPEQQPVAVGAQPSAEIYGCTSVSFVCDAFQIVIIDDSNVKPVSLGFLSMSSLKGACIMEEGMKASISAYIFIHFYNKVRAAWEPMLEDWNFSLTYEQNNDTTISFDSPSVMNLNMPFYIVRSLGTLYQKIYEDESFWEYEKGHISRFTSKEYKEHGYVLVNQLGTEIKIWLDAPGNTEEWYISDSQSFSQNHINQTLALSSKNLVKPGVLEDIRAPALLALEVPGFEPVRKLNIERFHNVGFWLKGRGDPIPCVMQVYADVEEKVILIQYGVSVVNNLDFGITLRSVENHIRVPANESLPLPLNWAKLSDIKIDNAEDHSSFYTSSYLRFQDGQFAVKSIAKLKTTSKIPQWACVFSAPFTMTNILPYDIKLLEMGLYPTRSKKIMYLDPEDKDASLRIEMRDMLRTEDVPVTSLVDKADIRVRSADGDFPNSGLTIKSVGQMLDNPSFTLADKKILNKSTLILPQELVVYARFVLVNRTELDLLCGRKTELPVKPNSIAFFWSDRPTIRIRVASHEKKTEFSNHFNIQSVSVSGCLEMDTPRDDHGPKKLLVGVRIIQAFTPIPRSKIIYFQPRFVILNNLPYPVAIRQGLKHGHGDEITPIQAGESLAYQLEDAGASKLIQISRNEHSWSTSFSLEEIEDFQVKFEGLEEERKIEGEWYEPTELNNFMHIARVIVTTEDEATLFISLVTPNNPEFLICNRTEEDILVKQADYRSLVVQPSAKVPWVFDNLRINKKVTLTCSTDKEEYYIEKIRKFPNLGDYSVEVISSGVTREIRIFPKRASFMEKDIEYDSIVNYKYTLELAGLCISIINEKPMELFCLSLQGISSNVTFTDKVVGNRRDADVDYNFNMMAFQLDNMHTKGVMWPVIIAHIPAESEEPTPFIQVKLQKTSTFMEEIPGTIENASIEKYRWFEVSIQEITTKINQEVAMELLSLTERLQNAFFVPKDVIKNLSEDFSVEEICPELVSDTPSLSSQELYSSKMVYLELVRLGAIKFHITFTASHSEPVFSTYNIPVLQIFSALGKSVVNITDSPLYFQEIIFKHSFKTLDNLIALLMRNYTRQGILQFYKILGSSDLIGNPIGLIDKIGTGVFQFVNEPTKGLLKGPKAFAEGVGKGVKNLVGSIIEGGFGSVSKITGSLYNMVKDIEGEDRIEKINEDDNALEIFGEGLKEGALHLYRGVTGIFTKPWKGAKSKGVKGFFLGVGKGVVGLVMAPVGAVLRVGQGIAAGFAEVGVLVAKGKVKKKGRFRFPRFISPRGVIEGYNYELAQAQELISNLDDHKKEIIVFYLHLRRNQDIIVILTMKHLLVLFDGDLDSKIRVRDIRTCEVHRIDNTFHIALVGDDDNIVISSKRYHLLAKLYCAITLIAKNIKNNRKLNKIKIKHYRKCCC